MKSKLLARSRWSPEQKRELTAYDMLVDAPPFYSPRWLDCLPPSGLKSQLQMTYLDLRQELADRQRGRGISISQDLLIRRVVYHDRMATRMEYAMEYWTMQLAEAKTPADVAYCEEMSTRYIHLYTQATVAMTNAMRLLGLAKAPVKPSASTTPQQPARVVEFKGGNTSD